MAYLNEHIQEYRLKRDDIMLEVTDAAGDSVESRPRFPGFSRHFKSSMSTSHCQLRTGISASGPSLSQRAPSSRTSYKYALGCLAGQERMCRMSGMRQ